MVVDDVEDLIDLTVGHFDVGDVSLPALVGKVRLETDPAGLGALVGLGDHEAPGDEDPVDGRDRRHLAPGRRHVEVDRLGSGIEAGSGQLFSDPHDLVLVEVGNARRARLGPPRAWLETLRTFEAVAPQQLEEPALAHVVGGRQLLDGTARPQVRLDQEPALVHRRPLPIRTLLCLDTSLDQGLSYVVKSDTVGGCFEATWWRRFTPLRMQARNVAPPSMGGGNSFGKECSGLHDDAGEAVVLAPLDRRAQQLSTPPGVSGVEEEPAPRELRLGDPERRIHSHVLSVGGGEVLGGQVGLTRSCRQRREFQRGGVMDSRADAPQASRERSKASILLSRLIGCPDEGHDLAQEHVREQPHPVVGKGIVHGEQLPHDLGGLLDLADVQQHASEHRLPNGQTGVGSSLPHHFHDFGDTTLHYPGGEQLWGVPEEGVGFVGLFTRARASVAVVSTSSPVPTAWMCPQW